MKECSYLLESRMIWSEVVGAGANLVFNSKLVNDSSEVLIKRVENGVGCQNM
jgi:hypothetical protein